MPEKRDRRYYLIKHDLRSFEVLPGVIWRTGVAKTQMPWRFDSVQIGDRWVEFAYIKDEERREPCSKVVGFYECVGTASYEPLPPSAAELAGETFAWTIRGKVCGEQPKGGPLIVPSIDEMLGRRHFAAATFVPLRDGNELERIRRIALADGGL